MSFLKQALHHLLPNSCYLCGGTSEDFLCSGCVDDLPLAGSCRSCDCCALPLSDYPARGDGSERRTATEPDTGPAASGILCGDCLSNPKPFQRTVAAFTYAHPIDFLINRFKHHRHFVCGNHLSHYLLPLLRTAYAGDTWPSLLLPMPLHWTRRYMRGFNQSDAIASQLQAGLDIPVSHCCRRLKRNPRQQGLKRSARLHNLHKAFAVQGSAAKESLKGRHVAVIDDVMTTGATVTELAHCLRKAGAARVDVWVLARVA